MRYSVASIQNCLDVGRNPGYVLIKLRACTELGECHVLLEHIAKNDLTTTLIFKNRAFEQSSHMSLPIYRTTSLFQSFLYYCFDWGILFFSCHYPMLLSLGINFACKTCWILE